MDHNIDNICQTTKRVDKSQLLLFTQVIRRHLLKAGIDRDLLSKALKEAVKEFRAKQTYDRDCKLALKAKHADKAKENRGIDCIGRILVEYCFFLAPEKKLIWPDNSEKDIQARISFTEGVIPRPLMRYFLISVRGSIPQLDKFEASSVLFGEENTAHEERKKYVHELIMQFRQADPKNNIDWKAVYADTRFQKIALELIGDIRRKIEQFSLERYLRILENIRQRDPAKNTINAMERAFSMEDVKLIDESLWAAERVLAQNIE